MCVHILSVSMAAAKLILCWFNYTRVSSLEARKVQTSLHLYVAFESAAYATRTVYVSSDWSIIVVMFAWQCHMGYRRERLIIGMFTLTNSVSLLTKK